MEKTTTTIEDYINNGGFVTVNNYHFNGEFSHSQINTGDKARVNQTNNEYNQTIKVYLNDLRDELQALNKQEYLKDVDCLEQTIKEGNRGKAKEILQSLAALITSSESIMNIADKLNLLPL